jgi:hypothetical protein
MSGKVKESGRWPELLKEVCAAAKGPSSVLVGIQSEDGEHEHDAGGKISNAALAQIHEYGSFDGKHPPQRSFIRSTVFNRGDDIDQLRRVLYRQFIAGKITLENALGKLGEKLQAWMQKTIGDGIEPELAESTLRQRKHGGSKPLLDTGVLQKSIKWKIVA